MAYNDNSINRDVILNYAFSTYGTEPEYPWESSPDNAVLRNMMSGKWYAIVMRVKRQILGLDGDGCRCDECQVRSDSCRLAENEKRISACLSYEQGQVDKYSA